jgi:hypothetical protein
MPAVVIWSISASRSAESRQRRGPVVLAAQNTQQTAQFVQGGASGVPDRRHRPPRLCRIVGEHRVRDHRLYHDDAHAVRHDVVELASDP